MKKGKIKPESKVKKKALREELVKSLTAEINEAVEKLGLDSKKAKKEIKRVAKLISKKASVKTKKSKSDITEKHLSEAETEDNEAPDLNASTETSTFQYEEKENKNKAKRSSRIGKSVPAPVENTQMESTEEPETFKLAVTDSEKEQVLV